MSKAQKRVRLLEGNVMSGPDGTYNPGDERYLPSDVADSLAEAGQVVIVGEGDAEQGREVPAENAAENEPETAADRQSPGADRGKKGGKRQ